MALLILYWLLVLACCGFAAVWGGRTGRWGCAIVVVGYLLSLVAALMDARWIAPHYLMFGVDMACTAAFVWLALWSRRYWPIWSTAFQLTATIMHLVRLISPHASAKLYQAAEAFWSLPMLLAMVIGVSVDRARGLRD